MSLAPEAKRWTLNLFSADSDEGVVSLRNKQDRVAHTRAMLDKIICEEMVKPHDLPLRLAWAECNFGHANSWTPGQVGNA